jgi:hypothetical protein
MMKRSLYVLYIMVLMVSCTSFFDNTSEGTVYGDAFIKTVADSSTVLYAPVFYIYGNQPMIKATVAFNETPDDIVILDSLDYGYTFARFPSAWDLKEEKPRKGNYRFEGFFGNQLYSQSIDYLSDKVIEPSEIFMASLDRGNQTISLEWKYDLNAENHKVAIFASNGKVIYESSLLSRSQNSLEIEKTSIGWFNSTLPKNNDSISIEVLSYLFEPILSSFDLQCMSVSKRVVLVW